MVSSKGVFAGVFVGVAGSLVLCGTASARPVMIEVLASGEFNNVNAQYLPTGPFGEVYEGQRWSARYVFPADVGRTFGNENSSIWSNALDPITFSFDGAEPFVVEPVSNGINPYTDLAANHHAGRDTVFLRFGLPRADGRTGRLMIRANAAGESLFGQATELNSTDLVGLEFSDFDSFDVEALDIYPNVAFRGTVDSFVIRFDPDSVVPAPAAASLLALAGLAAARRRRA